MADHGGYGLVPQTNFAGGLNLAERTDLIEPAQAIDLRDVMFPETGGIRQRDAYRTLTAAAVPNAILALSPHYESSGLRHLLVGNGARVSVIGPDGTLLASSVVPSDVRSFARFAAPGSELTYIATGFDPPMTWDGTVFATPAYAVVTPTGKFLAVQAVSNRLVAARESAFPDRVRFSDPSAPTLFQTNNYVDLRPGSGEPITALVSWHEYVFAFKESEFFVFYGNSTNSIGGPEFNFRPVSDKAGSLGAVAVAPEGVYFMDRRGVWLTSGGEPKLVSGNIDGLFTGLISPYYTGGALNQSQAAEARMVFHAGKVYLSYYSGANLGSGTNDKMAVFDTKTGAWSIYNIFATALATYQSDGGGNSDYRRDKLVIGLPNQHVGVYWEGSDYTMDGAVLATGVGGSAITSHWRQGWSALGSGDQKWLRQTKLWGTGPVRVGVQTDYVSATGTLDTAVLSGAGDQIAKPWLISQSRIGHVFSLYIASNGEPWSLNSIEHGFRQGRGSEVLSKRT